MTLEDHPCTKLVTTGDWSVRSANYENLSRRRWCQLAIASAASTFSSQSSFAQNQRGWIDAHVHVWTPNVERYPLDASYQRTDMQPLSFTPEELFAHSRPAGVDRIVLIQMSFYNYDNSYMLDMIAQHRGVFSGIAIVDHAAPDLAEQMQRLASQGVRGFRIHARHDQARGWVENGGMARMWKTAEQEELAVCPLINPSDLPFVDKLCAKFSDTRVVVDHFARIGIDGTVKAEELAALCRLARFPNVYVKTSAFYALGNKQPPYHDLLPMLNQVLEAFGPQRLMWASDCPFQVQPGHTYEASIALIRDADPGLLSSSDRQWLLRGTAEKVFF